jgi:xylulokinase
LVRAILEGVAFSLRDSIEIFRALGAELSAIRLGGGGARSPLWRQIQADVYDCPAEIIETDEGAAFGAAILAGVGSGAWKTVDEACERTIRISKRIEPDRSSTVDLEHNYDAYRLLYDALRPAIDRVTSGQRNI